MFKIGEIVEYTSENNDKILGIIEDKCHLSDYLIVAETPYLFSEENIKIVKDMTMDEFFKTNSKFKMENMLKSCNEFNNNILTPYSDITKK